MELLGYGNRDFADEITINIYLMYGFGASGYWKQVNQSPTARIRGPGSGLLRLLSVHQAFFLRLDGESICAARI